VNRVNEMTLFDIIRLYYNTLYIERRGVIIIKRKLLIIVLLIMLQVSVIPKNTVETCIEYAYQDEVGLRV